MRSASLGRSRFLQRIRTCPRQCWSFQIPRPRRICFERTDDDFLLLIWFCFFHLQKSFVSVCSPLTSKKTHNRQSFIAMDCDPIRSPVPITIWWKRTTYQGCSISPDFVWLVLSHLFPVPSMPDLPRCRFWEILVVAKACLCLFLSQTWQTLACFLAFVQQAGVSTCHLRSSRQA